MKQLSRSESLGSCRPASVVLLDDRRLELSISPRLLGGELLDLVASHLGLQEEKEYFGLAVLDEEKGLTYWLSLERKVLEQELQSKHPKLTFHFLVKFFIESIAHLSEVKTVELFYLQARSLIGRGALEAEADILAQLSALSIQGAHGDLTDDQGAMALIKKATPPTPSPIETSSIHEHYRATKGQTRGMALVNYMSIIESLPTYGVHYFEVFDKRQKPWWLGLSCKGIAQYPHNDRRLPVRVFQWKRLENLYFRDKKFSIEVHDLKRVIQAPSSTDLYEDSLGLEDADLLDAIQDASTRVSSSRRSFHPGSIRVYVWFGKTQGLTKCIWQSAISQHQFYLDRKRAKLRHHAPPRSLNDIARDLTRSSTSLSSASSLSNLSRVSSNQSLVLGAVGGKENDEDEDASQEVSEETRRARMEMLSALRTRREALNSKLREKTQLLKELCLKEGELTGDLPPETPLSPGENLPIIRRRIGTEFELNFERLLLNNPSSSSPQAELLANLELEREIQLQITNAAYKISNDSSVSKSVRKQRKISYQQSQRKLKEIESKLADLRKEGEDNASELRRRLSVPDLERCPSISSIEEEEERTQGTGRSSRGAAALSPRSCPTSPRKNPGRPSDPGSLEDHHSQRFVRPGGGYVPNSVYLRSSYRVKQYPTLTSSTGGAAASVSHSSLMESPFGPRRRRLQPHHHMPVPTPEMVLGSTSSRSATLPSPYRNKYELNSQCDSPVGLYNCPQQRTSQAFSSLDDIDALQQIQQQMAATSSSPGARRLETAAGNYPSLERSARKKRNESTAVGLAPPRPMHPPPKPPKADIRRSLEDLSALEAAGLHGRSKMRYEEIRSNDEYPGWSSPREAGGTYPLPLPVNRTTLLPGQTYPEPSQPPREQLLHIGLLNPSSSSSGTPPTSNSIQESSFLKDEQCKSEEDPPPLYPKQYYARRRSGLMDRDSPAVNRKVKPPHISSPSAVAMTTTQQPTGSPAAAAAANHSSFDSSVIVAPPTPSSGGGDHHHHRAKYVPYKETTKPFEMSDFYKYSTKYHRHVSASSLKSGESGGDSSDRSSTTSAGSNQPPPEIPARANSLLHPPHLPSSSPLVQTATVSPTKSKLSAQNSDSSLLGDAFSSEMLAWYNNQKQQPGAGGSSSTASNSSNSGSNSSSNANNKSATLV